MLFTGESDVYDRCNKFWSNNVLPLYSHWCEAFSQLLQLNNDIEITKLNIKDLDKFILTESDMDTSKWDVEESDNASTRQHKHNMRMLQYDRNNQKTDMFMGQCKINKDCNERVINKMNESTELSINYMKNIKDTDVFKNYITDLRSLILSLHNELQSYEK